MYNTLSASTNPTGKKTLLAGMYGMISNEMPMRHVNELFFSTGHNVEIRVLKEDLLWLATRVVVWETFGGPKNSKTSV